MRSGTLQTLLLVMLGSAVGGGARLLLGAFVQEVAGIAFPYATLVINVGGSFLLGFLMKYCLATSAVSPEVRALLTTGLCGGFTTFSTFSYESVALIDSAAYWRAGVYITVSVILAILAVVGGVALARTVLEWREVASRVT